MVFFNSITRLDQVCGGDSLYCKWDEFCSGFVLLTFLAPGIGSIWSLQQRTSMQLPRIHNRCIKPRLVCCTLFKIFISNNAIAFQSSNVSNINSLDFFNVGWHFLLSDSEFILTNGPNLTTAVASNQWPNIWVQADAFAKVFYSAILADLGQGNGSNILSNPALLQNYTNFNNITNNATGVETPWLQAGPARSSYDDLASSLGPLGITPSTIYAQYFCQIPEIKAGGTLFVTILVADLVFVQALWQILKWTTSAWLERHDEQMNYCPGCLETDAKEGISDVVAARLLDENGEARWPRYKTMRHSEEEVEPFAPLPVARI